MFLRMCQDRSEEFGVKPGTMCTGPDLEVGIVVRKLSAGHLAQQTPGYVNGEGETGHHRSGSIPGKSFVSLHLR